MMLLTVNERLIEDLDGAQRQLLADFKEAIEAVLLRTWDEAKQTSARILNAWTAAAENALIDAVATATSEATKMMAEQFAADGQRQWGH